ncbi:unnamed protein product, partial [Prunus brigantina]
SKFTHRVHAHILDFDDDLERTLRRKRKQPELSPPSSSSEPESEAETDLEEEQDMAVDNRSIKELSASELDNAVPLCIQYPRAAAGKTDEFELKSSLLHHIPRYHGLSMEDPNKHLKEFEVVCSSMTPINVDGNILKMKAFPFSLMDKAKDWLYELAPGTVTSWESMKKAFLEKFFPTSRIIVLRKKISGIQQGPGESFPVYYERFKTLVASCPQHQMKEELLIQYFYEGLLPLERQMLDASAGGALVDKTPILAAKILIANRALNAQQYEGVGGRDHAQPSQVNEVSAISELQSQMANLSTLISQMSDNSERESQSPPSPHAFSGEEFESGSHDEALGTDEESTGSDRIVEGLVVEGSRVGEEEQSRSSGGEAYKEMQSNYVTLEACANRVLGITQAPEASASGRAGPSGCGTVVVASADVGISVGVPLLKKNMMSLYDLKSLKVDYAIPKFMYKHRLRLPLHHWVQMMLSRLGYAPGQYNPNFWCIQHGVYIAWWLAKRGEPTFEQFMHLYSGNFGCVQVNCRKAKERRYFIGQPSSSQKTWRNWWFFSFSDWECWSGKTVSKHVPTQPVSREEEEEIELVRRLVVVTMEDSPKVVVDSEETQRKLRERREKDRANRAKKQAKGATSTAEGAAARAAEKRPRQEDDGQLAELEKKRRGLESSIHDVMGGTVLPPVDLDPPLRLPLEMGSCY